MPIKRIHRIPVEEDFIKPIGEAICICQRLDFALRYIGQKLKPSFYGSTLNLSSNQLKEKLEGLLRKSNIEESLRLELQELCKKAEAIFKQRNKIVHSHSYTTPQGHQSRLYRRKEDPKYTYLSPEDIKTFTEQAANVARKANELFHDPRMVEQC